MEEDINEGGVTFSRMEGKYVPSDHMFKTSEGTRTQQTPQSEISPSITGFSVAIGILQDLRIKKRRAEGLVSLCVDVRSL